MEKDFLNAVAISSRTIKKNIRNICDSYSNPWDIPAELSQNSIDAINKWNTLYSGGLFDDHRKQHYIELSVNRHNRSIEIKDSGIGFDPSNAAEMLAPNNGDKDSDPDLIGEKGVGLTFAIFSSNSFVLETKSVKGTYRAEVKGAKDWRDGTDFTLASMPKIINEEIDLTPL
jgi:molecular chaperone HtpG